MIRALIAAAAVAAPLFFAAPAHCDAGDVMYLVGTEIQPGTYRYTVTDQTGAHGSCAVMPAAMLVQV